MEASGTAAGRGGPGARGGGPNADGEGGPPEDGGPGAEEVSEVRGPEGENGWEGGAWPSEAGVGV